MLKNKKNKKKFLVFIILLNIHEIDLTLQNIKINEYKNVSSKNSGAFWQKFFVFERNGIKFFINFRY